nr:dentin sialophosphoprotein isoform X1 [Leptinotarsa decemlineata]
MWIIVLPWCISVVLVMSLVFCICWRKKTPKDEWQGLDGMVTQKNPDENVNHLHSAAPCVVDVLDASGDSLDTNGRTAVTNTRRSLPDIPSEQGTAVNWYPTGDNSSEHYATVGQYQNSAKRHTLSNGVEQRPSISQHSSLSQADETFSPYERVKYDKIKSKEHPYAQLQPTTSRCAVTEEIGSISEERITLLRPDVVSSSNELTDPLRSRRSSSHSNEGLDIPAASAVAGVLAASPDLPYMTPPVMQVNFSGDSQDSSKGYTSISVREPLANIIAQTKELTKNKRELDPHYSTVSDDSDDVYTTIPDANNPIYTSESETYARIPPLPITVEVEVNAPPSSHSQIDELDETADEIYEPPPERHHPPSIDSLKHVPSHGTPSQTFSHSRQASSSSSVANLGSPKPEKRKVNSPLPPPPTLTNFDFHSDKLLAMRNIDDLYAKVHKNKKEEPNGDMSEKSDCSSDIVNHIATPEMSITPDMKNREHDYETLKKSFGKTSDPDYEKIRGTDEPGYASINGPESIQSSDPGYEVLKDQAFSDCDPNYEELRHRVSNASDCSDYTKIKDLNDGYSVVNKRNKKLTSVPAFNSEDGLDEPNYESMPSEIVSDPNYAGAKSNGSESDPNYESVSQSDPNYESVTDLEDPPYERLDEDTSKSNADSSGYEKIEKKVHDRNDTSDSSNSADKSSLDKTDPPYEHLTNDSDSKEPGYEEIKNKPVITTNFSGSSGNSVENTSDILDEDGIVQV